jgi:hypothetical protein
VAPIHIFDHDLARVEHRPKYEAEPLFAYYNTSARPSVAALRGLLEQWFDQDPEETKTDLRERFRSPIDVQHQAAFFELYVHRLVSAMGYELKPHPAIPGSGSHPDFLVCKCGTRVLFLETTIAASSAQEQGQEKRAAVVYDTLDGLDSPNFFLHIDVRGAPNTPPAGARLREDLHKWLATLDPEELATQLSESGLDGLPTFEWQHDGWILVFFPIPKERQHRGKAGVRPVGSRVSGGWSRSHEPLRKAVSSKGKKYTNADLPLVVAVNVLDESTDGIDVMNALLGEECITFPVCADGRPGEPYETRKRNGAWTGPHDPKGRNVSAVMVAYHLNPWRMAVESPRLIHHPWARRPLAPELWPLEQWVPDDKAGRYDTLSGKTAVDILSLPNPWPPNND